MVPQCIGTWHWWKKKEHPPQLPILEISTINKEGEEVYEVEKILDKHKVGDQWLYLVSWKGFGPEHNSWEPERNLADARRLVSQFNHEQHIHS